MTYIQREALNECSKVLKKGGADKEFCNNCGNRQQYVMRCGTMRCENKEDILNKKLSQSGKIYLYGKTHLHQVFGEVEEVSSRLLKNTYMTIRSYHFEVSQETEVSVEKIMRFIGEERLEIKSKNTI